MKIDCHLLRASRNLSIGTLLLVALMIVVGTPTILKAQSAVQDNSIKDYKMPTNWKKYFEEKYKDLRDIYSNVQERPEGPLGNLSISGHFKINVEATSGDRQDRARAIAQTFLRNEKKVLGLRDLNELREYKIVTDMGHDGKFTDIYYDRYIGELRFDAPSTVHITIGPDETIWFVRASLVPSPAELYQAAAKKLLTKEEAIHIVEQDIRAMVIDPIEKIISSSNIFVSVKSPYIFWVVSAHGWTYTIDAITGNRIRKGKHQLICDPGPCRSDSDQPSNLLDFGPVYVGELQWERLPLSNLGATSLKIQTAYIEGDEDFSIKPGDDSCSGKSLDYEQICTVRVSFVPSAAGQKNAVLKILSNAQNGISLTPLRGTGVSVDTLTITATAGEGGTIAPSGITKVFYNNYRNIIITPDPGYRIGDVQVDGKSVGTKSSYVFTNVTVNHTITANFIKNESSVLHL